METIAEVVNSIIFMFYKNWTKTHSWSIHLEFTAFLLLICEIKLF